MPQAHCGRAPAPVRDQRSIGRSARRPRQPRATLNADRRRSPTAASHASGSTACAAPWPAPSITRWGVPAGAAAASRAAASGRDQAVRPAMDEEEREVLQQPDDRDRLGRPRIAADEPTEPREGSRGQAHPARDAEVAAHDQRQLRASPSPRRRPRSAGRGASTAAAGASGSASADGSRPSPSTAVAASATMPPIDEPTSATRRTPRSPSQANAPATSSTSSSPNVVGAVVRAAVAAEVEPEHARRPPQERPQLDEVGRDRAAVAVQQQDRLARVGGPVPPGRRRRAPSGRSGAPRRASAA